MTIVIGTKTGRSFIECTKVVRLGNDYICFALTGEVIKVTGLNKCDADLVETHFYGTPTAVDFVSNIRGAQVSFN